MPASVIADWLLLKSFCAPYRLCTLRSQLLVEFSELETSLNPRTIILAICDVTYTIH